VLLGRPERVPRRLSRRIEDTEDRLGVGQPEVGRVQVGPELAERADGLRLRVDSFLAEVSKV